MTGRTLDTLQHVQDEQYDYPYHYIPTLGDDTFSQVHYWSWGFRYMGGMKVVTNQLETRTFRSLIDIGCGDGRFLREVSRVYPTAELLGVDYSEKAVRLAKAMNPDLRYEVVNLIDEDLSTRFDVATMIEVLEHIPLEQVPAFCEAAVRILNDGGRLIITVPHENSRLLDKHYQHFTSQSLRNLLEAHFREITFIPFDGRSRFIMGILKHIIGGDGHHFVLTNRKVLSWFYRVYTNRYLYASSEEECGRIAAVCTK